MLDTKIFLGAIDELESKGIAREITIQALTEAFESIFKKKGYEDTRVQVDILPEKGEINIYQIKKVVEEVEDDAIEIELEDAQEINPNIKIGEDLYEKVELDDLSKAEATKFKSILKQKIKEAEKAAIYEAYADKQGELIPGVVEKIEPNFTCINIGRVTVVLPNSHKIGDEKFEIGQTVKVHLAQVNSSVGGPQLHVSRADQGFLKRLFEEEVREIYDGIIEIKDVAREAGERSKVSVITHDDDVDPVGACIGQGGTKIQKICNQIGKEKIDIVKYHELPALFIAEALKPAVVLGVAANEETKHAIAVVKNNDLRVAIGKRGINVTLAARLTGWKIDIKETDDALKEGIAYDSIEVLEAKEKAYINEKTRKVIMEELQLPKIDEILEEENKNEPLEVKEEVAPATEEEIAVEEEVEEVQEPVKESPKEEVKFEEVKVEIKNSAKVSLSDLEKQIDDEKKKKSQQPKSYKKLEKVEKEEKEEKEEKINRSNYLEVEYTEDELKEIEEEENEEYEYDEDVDYSEFDKYYED